MHTGYEFVFVFQNHKLQYYNIKTDTKQLAQNIELVQKANQLMSVKCFHNIGSGIRPKTQTVYLGSFPLVLGSIGSIGSGGRGGIKICTNQRNL